MGRKEYEKVTAIQSNPSQKVIAYASNSTTPVVNGVAQKITIFASAGKIAKLINLFITYPAIAAATTGTKRITLALLTPAVGTGGIGLCYVDSDYNVNLSIVYGGPENAKVNGVFPSDLAAFQAQLANIHYDDQLGLGIYFDNFTNSPAIENRTYFVFTAETKTS